jgi:hypothetical protein
MLQKKERRLFMKIYTDDPIKGEVLAGDYDEENKVFTKKVTRKKHLFRLFTGYAIQKDVTDKLQKKTGVKVVIIEKDTGDTYTSWLDDWYEHGSIWTGKSGKQKTLSLKYMKLVKPE